MCLKKCAASYCGSSCGLQDFFLYGFVPESSLKSCPKSLPKLNGRLEALLFFSNFL
jgi:hypothetical protein